MPCRLHGKLLLRSHQHSQQEAAAKQALVHLRTAYAQVAIPALNDLARRTPGVRPRQRYARLRQQAAPEHADRIVQAPPGKPCPPLSPKR
ncbi:hypothetical protein NGM37_07950, partial [Streptomyces sp. TRM76130]|nr:hypothetical protein [Streptomyces sp. TRM76130]